MELAIELVKWLGLALVFLLGPVFLIHEIGHFVTAKRSGVRVLEFGLGFPPRLLTLAQEPGVLEVVGTRMILPPRLRFPRDLEIGQTVRVRAHAEADGSFTALQIARLDESTTLERAEAEQEVVREGALSVFEPGTRYTLNLLPMGGFVRMLGEEDPSHERSLAAKPKRTRLTVILAGVVANLLAALLLLSVAYMMGAPNYFVEVSDVEPGSPADVAGLEAGDILTAVGEEPLSRGPAELRDLIRALPDQTTTLTVLREGEELILAATPRLEGQYGYLGIYMLTWRDPSNLTRYSVPDAFVKSASDFVQVFVNLFRLPRMVADGDVAPSDVRPTAMPGILQLLALALKQSVEWGLAFPALQFTAMISLAVGLTNLLPLPALDGGRAVFVLIEAIRGRRVSPTAEAAIHMVGLAILLILSVVIIFQDIFSPLIPWSTLGP